jgi:hypothetical protein
MLRVGDEAAACSEVGDEAATCSGAGVEDGRPQWCGSVRGDKWASFWQFQKFANCCERARRA